MRKKPKILHWALFLMLVFATISCDKDFYDIQDPEYQKMKDYKLKSLRYSDLKRDKNAFSELKKSAYIKKPELRNFRGTYSQEFGVFIDTTNIIKIESENHKTITAPIINNNESKLENLVLNLEKNGNYKAYITNYAMMQGKLTNNTPTSIIPVATGSGITIGGNGANCFDIITTTTHYCRDAQGNTMVDNGELGNGCLGMSWDETQIIAVIDMNCLTNGGTFGVDPDDYNPYNGNWDNNGGNNGGIGGDGANQGGSSGNNNGNNGGNDNGNEQNDGLTDGNGNPIVTTPTMPNDPTPCEQLQSLGRADEQNIKPVLNELKQKLSLNLPKEYASTFEFTYQYNQPQDEYVKVYQNSPIVEGQLDFVNSEVGAHTYGQVHTHPKGTYGIFSWGDLSTLKEMDSLVYNIKKPYVILMVMSPNPNNPSNPNVYSVKIDDIETLKNKIENDWNDPKLANKNDDEKRRHLNKKMGDFYGANTDLEKAFLQYFEGYGVSLYKADGPNINSWNKLKLSTNNTVEEEPCN